MKSACTSLVQSSHLPIRFKECSPIPTSRMRGSAGGSLDALASKSAVSKNTLKRYMEYLEAAFLIRPVMRVDQKAGRFQRDRTYKVMLTNPSLRTGLFNFVGEHNPALGSLVETAVFAQRFHRIDEYLHYARWKLGRTDQELDMVVLDPGLRVTEAVEVKYTDRVTKQRREWEPWINFCKENGLSELTVRPFAKSPCV